MKYKMILILSLMLFFFVSCPDEKKENELSTYILYSVLINATTQYDCVTSSEIISDTYNKTTITFEYKPQYYNSPSGNVVPKAIMPISIKKGQTIQVSSVTTNVKYEATNQNLTFLFRKEGCHGTNSEIATYSGASYTNVFLGNTNTVNLTQFKFTTDYDGIILIVGKNLGASLPRDIHVDVF
ncbi:hypothetical protein [Leptospira noguchii]|uniref:hypothetical protein n=1 Tax=Leptospira noguchii TaxID=28182 RepID=UPI000773CAC9|nr:hypothetical protein [Leptospira noguchii]